MAVSGCPALVDLKITSYLTQVSFREMIKILNKFLHRNHSVNNASKNKQENGRAYISHLNSLSTILWSNNNGNRIRYESSRPKFLNYQII